LLHGLRHFVHLATNRRWNKKKKKNSSFRFFSCLRWIFDETFFVLVSQSFLNV
jgi:hypothetical protein